jgi:hypothetical protein
MEFWSTGRNLVVGSAALTCRKIFARTLWSPPHRGYALLEEGKRVPIGPGHAKLKLSDVAHPAHND